MKLQIQTGGQAGRIISMNGQKVRVGREEKDNDVVIAHPQISRKHCVFENNFGRWSLMDMGSSSGTTINNTVIGRAPTLVKPGDLISLGPIQVKVLQEELTPFRTESDLPKHLDNKKTGNGKKSLVLIALVAMVAILWMDDDDEINRLKRGDLEGRKSSKSREPQAAVAIPNIGKEQFGYIQDPRKKDADAAFQRGFREFLMKNYYRALIEFEGSLRTYPGHFQADMYKRETEQLITKTASRELNRARVEIEQMGRYRVARRRVERASDMLKLRPSIPENKELIVEAKNLLDYLDKVEGENSP